MWFEEKPISFNWCNSTGGTVTEDVFPQDGELDLPLDEGWGCKMFGKSLQIMWYVK